MYSIEINLTNKEFRELHARMQEIIDCENKGISAWEESDTQENTLF